jgi:REP element-mobilizing transposase RayT
MARAPRIHIPGAWYHVTARGNERRAIFRAEGDYAQMLVFLETAILRFGLRLHGYVLMENHYHLILEAPEGNLSRAMQWLNVSYSVWFNRRRRRIGHLFAGRFKAIIADPQEWGLELSRYVHLNPLRTRGHAMSRSQRQQAGTGKRKAAAAAEIKNRLLFLNGYRWSSYRAFAGYEAHPPWLETHGVASLIEGDPRRWRSKYRALVEAGAREGAASPWPSVEAQAVLGGQELLEKVRTQIKQGHREIVGKRELGRRRTFEEAVAIVEAHCRRPWGEFKNRHGDPGREMVLWLARRHTGMTLGQLGERAGGADYAAVAMALRRFEWKMEGDGELRAEMQKLEGHLCNVKM